MTDTLDKGALEKAIEAFVRTWPGFRAWAAGVELPPEPFEAAIAAYLAALPKGELASECLEAAGIEERSGGTKTTIATLRAAAAMLSVPEGFVMVPVEPVEAQWSGLARDIMMWISMYPGSGMTPRSLFQHLELMGHEIPQWLRDEPEMQSLNHVPSKGTRAVIIYKAMVAARPDQFAENANSPRPPEPEEADVLRKARDDALEEAAQVCDSESTVEGIAQKCAAAIRALKGKEDGNG